MSAIGYTDFLMAVASVKPNSLAAQRLKELNMKTAQSNLETIDNVAGVWRAAKKSHPCNPYFTRKCKGTGGISAGQRYWSPDGDRIDAFHPYRICGACAAHTREQANAPGSDENSSDEFLSCDSNGGA